LRLIVAAFLLSAWVTVGLGSGIAHADDPSPSGSKSSSESPADATKPAKADRPKHSKADPPKHESADPPKHPKAGTPPSETKPSADDTKTDTKPAATVDQPSEPASEANADPDDPPKPSGRRDSHRPGLTIESVKPAKTDSPEPQASAAPATIHRSAVASAPQLSTQAASQQPAAAIAKVAAVAAVPVADPAPAPSGPNTRQVIGLVTDVGLVAASVVYTIADTVAQIFGPHSFLGVPYALATAVANAAAAVSRTLIGAPPGFESTGPFQVNYGVINGLSFLTPQKPPPGANDPSIKVTPEHPLPIILINGTIATQGENWGVGAPVLANAGYKVYSFNYGNVTSDPNFPIQATDDIRQSGLQLAAEVDKVLKETGAPKVILIGHSQGGGILPAYYINNLDGAAKVSQLIGIAPSNHGTDVDGLIGLQNLPILGPLVTAIANTLGQALLQQSLGSPFQQEVYGKGDTRPGVLYTTIASMNDEVVTPYTQQALDGPNVTNIVLQDLYPNLPAGHLGVVLSPQVWSVVLDALADNPAANPLLKSEALVA
jgi:pimeloyl-ACP methyl ester carboxylesterase